MHNIDATVPTIRSNVDIEAYHAGPEVSKSGLDLMRVSPFHYFSERIVRNPNPRAVKQGQLEGSLCHVMTLEPDTFDQRYAVGPAVNRNTKIWKEFVEDNAGRVCIQADQRETAYRQAESIRQLPELKGLFANGEAELSAYWTDKETSIACRCRPDFVANVGDGGVILLDVKTYSDASPAEFSRQVARKRYHVQDAYYTEGFQIAADKDVLAFIFVAVETSYPFAASACMLEPQASAQGAKEFRRDLNRIAECTAANDWPGFSKSVHLIDLPTWAYKE